MDFLFDNIFFIIIAVGVLGSFLRRILRGSSDSSRQRPPSQPPTRTSGQTARDRLSQARQRARQRLGEVRDASVSVEPQQAGRQAAQELEALLSGERQPSAPQRAEESALASTSFELTPQPAASLEEEPLQPAVSLEEVAPEPPTIDVPPTPRPRSRGGRLSALNSRAGLRQAVLAQMVLGRPKGLDASEEEMR